MFMDMILVFADIVSTCLELWDPDGSFLSRGTLLPIWLLLSTLIKLLILLLKLSKNVKTVIVNNNNLNTRFFGEIYFRHEILTICVCYNTDMDSKSYLAILNQRWESLSNQEIFVHKNVIDTIRQSILLRNPSSFYQKQI